MQSEAFRSAVAFRSDICETVTQLKQRYTRPLPDGATVYVTGARSLYRLVKDLGSTYDALTPIVVPADQSDNRWVQETDEGGSPWAALEVATASNDVQIANANAWIGLGSTSSGAFQIAVGDTGVFVVNPTTSVLTFHGPSQRVAMRYQVSLFNNNLGAFTAQAALSVNNDIPPGDTGSHYGAGEQAATLAVASGAVVAGTRYESLLSNGETVRLMLRVNSGTPVVTVSHFELDIAPR